MAYILSKDLISLILSNSCHLNARIVSVCCWLQFYEKNGYSFNRMNGPRCRCFDGMFYI